MAQITAISMFLGHRLVILLGKAGWLRVVLRPQIQSQIYFCWSELPSIAYSGLTTVKFTK